MNKEQVLEVVQERYGAIARGEQSGCGCGCKNEVAEAIGYTAEDLAFAGEGNLGLGPPLSGTWFSTFAIIPRCRTSTS